MNVEKIIKCLKELGTTKEAAARLGVTPKTVRNYKAGRSNPTLDTLHQLATQSGCRLSELVGRTKSESSPAIAESFVRICDLRKAAKTQPKQFVRVHCAYSLSIEEPCILPFYVGSQGDAISIEAPWSSENVPNTIYPPPGMAPSDDPVKPGRRRRKISFDCSTLKIRHLEISYSVLFENAFCGDKRAWLNVHVDYPAKSVLIVFLFPHDHPCNGMTLTKKATPSEIADDIEIRPIFLCDRTIVLFSAGETSAGMRFRADWKWGIGGMRESKQRRLSNRVFL